MINEERVISFMREVCEYLQLEVPSLVLTDSTRGAAMRTRSTAGVQTSISIPKLTLEHGDAFVKYYVVHECIHLAVNSGKHDKDFKSREAEVLDKVFAIGIKYSRSFPKYLFAKADVKNILWGKSEKMVGGGLCLKRLQRR